MKAIILILLISLTGLYAGAQCDTTLPNSRDGSFSPDGSQIVFSSSRNGNQDIYIMNSDGTNQTWLAGTDDADYYPKFSSDGKKILFDSYGKGTAYINIMKADGTGLKRLTSPDQFNTDAIMSPDMSKILFYGKRDGFDEIFVMDVDGSNVTALTNTKGNERTPVWSHDGKQIVFISGRDGNREVYIMRSDGSKQTRVTENEGPDLVASWSPDGKKILFYGKNEPSSKAPLAQAEILTINLDGTGRKNLTKDEYADQGPSYSPDGTQIVYTSCRGNRELFIMNSDGTNKRQLTFSLNDESKEIVAIQKIVYDAYIHPLYYRGDLEDLKKGIHEDFNMYVLYNGQFSKRSRDEWVEKLQQVRAANRPLKKYTYKFDQVDFEGHTAIVKLSIFEGKERNVVDYLSLYKFETGWKLLTKLFTMN